MIAGWSSQVAHRAHNPKVRGSNPLPATSFIFNNINILRALLCLKNRGLYFYTPHYTPHTFPFFPTNLLFQTQEVQTKPASRYVLITCLINFSTSVLPKNYLFVELHEQVSIAKVHWIEIVLSLGKKILVKGVGYKTGTSDYLEQPVPLLWG